MIGRPLGPDVDVVVLTWNDGSLLEDAISSVFESAGVAVHAIVVDNGSDPPATLACDGSVRWLRNGENRGIAAARNQGVRAGTSEFVCLLDSDARLEPDALASMVAVLDAHPKVGLVGPVFVGQAPEASAGRAPTLGTKIGRLLGRRSLYDVTERSGAWWDVDFCIGACQVIRRSAWEAAGGLDESYFYGPEDVDLCLRPKEQRWRVVQDGGASVHHPPRRRFRGVLTRRGASHAWAVCRHLWRHRGFVSQESR